MNKTTVLVALFTISTKYYLKPNNGPSNPMAENLIIWQQTFLRNDQLLKTYREYISDNIFHNQQANVLARIKQQCIMKYLS